jgi:hypothetical protein
MDNIIDYLKHLFKCTAFEIQKFSLKINNTENYFKNFLLSINFIILKKEYKIKVCKFVHKNSYSLKFTLIMDF